MSSNTRNASERQPLLGNDGAGDSQVDADLDKEQSWHDWASEHKLNIILSTLVVMFFAFFMAAFFTRLPNDKQTAPIPANICSAPGCVLAASTLLRSISPR